MIYLSTYEKIIKDRQLNKEEPDESRGHGTLPPGTLKVNKKFFTELLAWHKYSHNYMYQWKSQLMKWRCWFGLYT